MAAFIPGSTSFSLASNSLKEDDKKKKKEKATKKSAGVPQGSISAMFGGGGGAAGLAGTALQVGAGLVDSNAQKKAARRAENRPKHRRVAAALEQVKGRKEKRKLALATLAQATMDWANTIR